MKTSKDIKKKESALSEEEKKYLQSAIEDLKEIIAKSKVDEELVRKFSNIVSTLTSLKENYTWRILRALKQNHMLD